MSQGNVEVVRRLYEAMQSPDLEAAAAYTHPKEEWISDSRVGDAPVRGRENAIRFFTDRAGMIDDLRIEIERVSETGERDLVFLRLTGTGRASWARSKYRSRICGHSAAAWSYAARVTAIVARPSKPPGWSSPRTEGGPV